MKNITVTCDQCGSPVLINANGKRNFASLRFYASGYGLTDGIHNKRWDICSSKCGLNLLKAHIRSIETAD